MDDMSSSYNINACSSYPVAVDYSSVAGTAQDAGAATAAGWSLVDLKPCITPCGLSAYTGQHSAAHHIGIIFVY